MKRKNKDVSQVEAGFAAIQRDILHKFLDLLIEQAHNGRVLLLRAVQGKQ